MITNAAQHKIVDHLEEARNFNSSEYLLSDLRGDLFDYVIEGTAVGGLLGLKLNGDGANNYRNYFMRGLSSSASASVNDSTIINDIIGSTDTSKPSAFRLVITGDSPTERYINGLASVTGGIYVRSIYWKNLVIELNSIGFFDTVSRTTTADFRIYQIPKQSNLDNYDLIESVDFVSRNLLSLPIDFEGLDGDADGEYLIDWSADNTAELYINGSETNFVRQSLKNTSGIIGASNAANIHLFTSLKSELTISATSGRKRIIIQSSASMNTGIAINQREDYFIWPNIADNITELRIISTFGNIVTGSAKLYKRKSNKSIDPVPMGTAKIIDVAGNFSTGQTISNIQGDRIDGAIKLEYTGVGNADIEVQFNTIASNSNQQLKTSGSSVTVSSTSPTKIKLCGGSSDTTNTNSGVMWVYPKSGQNRPGLNEQSYNSNTLEKNAIWINDDINEIVSMTFMASNTNTMDGEILCSYPKNTKQASPSWT